jgi:potassium-transporting ATPase potassium-binding subunit
MNVTGWEQLLFVCAVTAVLAPLLGRYLAAVFRHTVSAAGGATSEPAADGKAPGDRVFLPAERLIYRLLRVDPDSSMTWQVYAIAVLVFGLLSCGLLYAILRLQGVLPLNPARAPGMSTQLAFNTAISFVTGTNWQAYEGETQASYLADMAGLVVAQFTAAAVGLAVALAVVRGIAGSSRRIGNFWVDFTRSLVRVFVPLSVLAAFVMVSQGVVQNLSGFRTASTLAGGTQQIPGGPVASMEVIKLLGTNGGSMYGAGGAHPFENPTGFTNIFDLLLVIVLPFAIIVMFGRLIGNHLLPSSWAPRPAQPTPNSTATPRSAAPPRSPGSCSARTAPAATAAACTASSCSRCFRYSSPASWSAGRRSSSARRSAPRR